MSSLEFHLSRQKEGPCSRGPATDSFPDSSRMHSDVQTDVQTDVQSGIADT